MSEKLQVEFEVERTVDRGYGYFEKYLMFNGNRTKYKAIVFDDGKKKKIVAIVSRQYKLIPNEELDILLDRIDGFRKTHVSFDGWRYYAILESEDGIVSVVNSVDGSIALKVIPVIKSNGVNILFPVKSSEAYRRHVGNVEEFVAALKKEILAMVETGKKIAEELTKAMDMPLKKEDIELLEEALPRKYVAGLSLYNIRGEMTVYDAFIMIARRIWSENNSIVTKMALASKLNLWLTTKLVLEI